MQYSILTSGDFEQLTRERIANLEAEHFSIGLLLDETTAEDETSRLRDKLLELERRISVHTATPGEENGDPADSAADR